MKDIHVLLKQSKFKRKNVRPSHFIYFPLPLVEFLVRMGAKQLAEGTVVCCACT